MKHFRNSLISTFCALLLSWSQLSYAQVDQYEQAAEQARAILKYDAFIASDRWEEAQWLPDIFTNYKSTPLPNRKELFYRIGGRMDREIAGYSSGGRQIIFEKKILPLAGNISGKQIQPIDVQRGSHGGRNHAKDTNRPASTFKKSGAPVTITGDSKPLRDIIFDRSKRPR